MVRYAEHLERDLSLAIEKDLLYATVPGSQIELIDDDLITPQAESHRHAIENHDRQIVEIARQRDIAIRGFEADLETMRNSTATEESRLTRAIAQAKDSAQRRIALREQLRRASQAALAALEPIAAHEGASTANDRLVPRSAGL